MRLHHFFRFTDGKISYYRGSEDTALTESDPAQLIGQGIASDAMHAALSDLGLTVPVIAAPMAGGPTTPALVVAAANAGALGFVAGGYLTADALAEQIATVRREHDHVRREPVRAAAGAGRPRRVRSLRRELQAEAERYGVVLNTDSDRGRRPLGRQDRVIARRTPSPSSASPSRCPTGRRSPRSSGPARSSCRPSLRPTRLASPSRSAWTHLPCNRPMRAVISGRGRRTVRLDRRRSGPCWPRCAPRSTSHCWPRAGSRPRAMWPRSFTPGPKPRWSGRCCCVATRAAPPPSTSRRWPKADGNR